MTNATEGQDTMTPCDIHPGEQDSTAYCAGFVTGCHWHDDTCPDTLQCETEGNGS